MREGLPVNPTPASSIEFPIPQTQPSTLKPTTRILPCGIFAVVALAVAPSAIAQEITGTPGSPSATVTLDGKQLPPAPMPSGGVIGEMSTGFPDHDSVICPEKATIGHHLAGQRLRDVLVRQEPQDADLSILHRGPLRPMAVRHGI